MKDRIVCRMSIHTLLLHYSRFYVELHKILQRDTHSIGTLKRVKSYFRSSMVDNRLDFMIIQNIETQLSLVNTIEL